jgi:hypothetical protein
MGLFDLFKAKPKDDRAPGAPIDKNVARLARIAGDKHSQNFDRMEALEALAKIGNAESAAGLLKRFLFHIDPSITDQEEKEVALRGVLAAGEAAVEPIRAFCVRAESLTWPLKILKELLAAERYTEELIQLLTAHDTEYVRNVEPKQQIISELEQFVGPEVRAAVEPFLEDVNDVVRCSAVATVLAQNEPVSAPALVATLVGEESQRLKNQIAEGLASRGWPVPEDKRAELRAALPVGYALEADGKVKRR